MVKYASYVKEFDKNRKTLIANSLSSKCMMISTEMAEILRKAHDNKYTFKQLYNCIEDEKSREIMKTVCQKLVMYKICCL